MNLRSKLILYFAIIHLIFAVISYFLFSENPYWLFAIEVFFLISLGTGITLIRSIFKPFQMIDAGTELIKERDFTSKFRISGSEGIDRLVDTYNQMIDQLREERLKLQEKNYFIEKVLDASPSAVITFDFDDRIHSINPAGEKILDLNQFEIIGKKLSEIDRQYARGLESLEIGDSKVIQVNGNRKLKCWKAEFLDKGFKRSFILLEELTEELRQTEKNAYEKLIRIMAHEVNNSIGAANSLLHSCMNYKNQLREEDRGDFERALNVVISRTDHLNNFMKSFADVIRLPNPDRTPADVYELLDNTVQLMRTQIKEKNITIDWDISMKLGLINLDKSQMEQVFVNLIKNSVEAIKKDGKITLRTGIINNIRFAEIEDNGTGIPPEVMENIYTPFFSTKEKGQGIGLTMVQEILNKHSFSFSVESDPDRSTKFTVFFNAPQ